MKKLAKLLSEIVIISSLLIFLVGCGSSDSVNKFNNTSYLNAKSIEPIKIPEELASTTYIEPYYPAPPGKYPERGQEPISELPPNLGELDDK